VLSGDRLDTHIGVGTTGRPVWSVGGTLVHFDQVEMPSTSESLSISGIVCHPAPSLVYAISLGTRTGC
jgi:hypothetical protein